MNTLTVFTQPGCGPCSAVLRFLNSRGIDHRIVNVREDAAAMEALQAHGFATTPVVNKGDKWIGGFRADQILALANS